MPPIEYEKIRDSYIARGYPIDKAKELAARTFISRHPGRAKELHHGKRKKKR